LEAEEVLEVVENLEESLETEGLQEVTRRIDQDMVKEVLTGQGPDFMEGQGHLSTSQGHMEVEEVHPEEDHLDIVHMEDLNFPEGVIRIQAK
jgi:hypothetical protein